MSGLNVPLVILGVIALALMAVGSYLFAVRLRHSARELQRRLEQLAVLNEVGRVISSSLQVDELLDKIHQQVSRLIDASNFYVALYDPATSTISFPVARENGQPWAIEPRQIGNGLTEYVLLTRHPLLIASNFTERLRGMGIALIGKPVRSWLGVPMIAGDQVIGVITVQSLYKENAYNQGHVEILQTIASEAAVAVANARLYQQTDLALAERVQELDMRNRQLREILSLGNALKSNVEVQPVLDQMVRAVVNSLGFNIALLNLVESGPPPYLRRVAAAGLPAEQWDRMCQMTIPLDEYTRQMRPEFRVSQSYFIGHEHAEVWNGVTDSYIPDLGPRTETEWHSNDALFVPLIDSSGQLMGVLSVDDPVDRRIPTQETIEALEVFATEASIAIEGTWLFQRVSDGRNRLQAILNTTRDGMLMIDVSGQIVVANPMIGEILGVQVSQLIDQRLAGIASALPARCANPGALHDVVSRALDDLEKHPAEIVKDMIETSEPQRVMERVSVPMFDSAGASIGRLLVLHDMTEQKKLEALREDLSRMMVHDLRAPLTSIIGGLQLLAERMADRPAELRILDLTSSSSNRLLGLINSLLDVFRMEAGQVPLKLQPVMWGHLIEVACERVESLAASEGVQVDVGAVDSLAAQADEEMIVRVMVNLLDNAIQYSPQGENARVHIQVRPGVQPNMTECRVIDHGPGIAPEYHDRLFQKFSQLPIAKPRRFRRGSGLGLAFSRLAIEAHGGRIWIEATPGGGSTFAFTLPCATAQPGS